MQHAERKIVPPADVERSFRDGLEGAVEIVEKLAPLCGGFEELIEMMKLGLNNDGQLRLLMKEAVGPRR